MRRQSQPEQPSGNDDGSALYTHDEDLDSAGEGQGQEDAHHFTDEEVAFDPRGEEAGSLEMEDWNRLAELYT